MLALIKVALLLWIACTEHYQLFSGLAMIISAVWIQMPDNQLVFAQLASNYKCYAVIGIMTLGHRINWI